MSLWVLKPSVYIDHDMPLSWVFVSGVCFTVRFVFHMRNRQREKREAAERQALKASQVSGGDVDE